MIKMTVEVKLNRIKSTGEQLKTKFNDFLFFLAEHGKEDIKDNYTTDHIPSSPGEPPAVRTGRLKESTTAEQHKDYATIDIGAEYAEWLEFGTSKIAPRPFVRPAVQRLENDIPALAKKVDW